MVGECLVTPNNDSLAIEHLLSLLGIAVTRHTQPEDGPLGLLGTTGADLVLPDWPGRVYREESGVVAGLEEDVLAEEEGSTAIG